MNCLIWAAVGKSLQESLPAVHLVVSIGESDPKGKEYLPSGFWREVGIPCALERAQKRFEVLGCSQLPRLREVTKPGF
jgi:hypothetical protein